MTAARRAAIATLAIDLGVRSKLWKQPPHTTRTIRRALRAAATRGRGAAASVTVILTDDANIRVINRAWRSIDRPTNVLSFPAAPVVAPLVPRHLGDIVLAYETVAREAVAEHMPFLDHLAHLAVHGFLHLLGYDHDADAAADAMEAEERAILATLGVADPYADGQRARAIKHR